MDTQETKVYLAALIAAGVLGVVLLYFIITMIRQQRITQKLNREKIEAEILTLEKERQRVASDLHDDLGPVLSAIKFKINSVESKSEEDAELIRKASDYVDETIQRIRQIAFNLMPNTLTRKGLVAATEELIGKITESLPLNISYQLNPIPDISLQKSINLFRMVQEIIQNTVKHSGASELFIKLDSKDKNIVLTTEDNGKGFDHEKVNDQNKGLGLRNLASRVEIMNGISAVETGPGKGVKYKFEIPID
jgi:two-component system, NarL family, sensor kinase